MLFQRLHLELTTNRLTFIRHQSPTKPVAPDSRFFSSLRKSDVVNNLKVLSIKKKIFVCLGVIGILGISYSAYHWFDGVTQYRIASMYYNGNIFQKNVSKAYEWLSKSSEKGNPFAQQLLGRCYIQGEGVEKNEKIGFKWLKKAAENGSPAAQYNLGSCYYNGTGTQKNNDEAFKWIRKAAEQKIAKNYFKEGTSKLYFILGQLYERGEGCEANKEEAVKWYARAASQGDVVAGKAVDRLKTGGAPETALKSYSVELLQKAESGDANAQYQLGQCYFYGLGTSKNDKEAFKWTSKSADQGNQKAEYNLGASYLQGIGTSKNETEAFKWYKKAADKGVPLAQYNLGVLYQKGIGVEKNDAEALTWFTKSADQGNAEAKKAVSCIKGEADAKRMLKESESKQQSSTNPQ